ncbi:dimethylallylcistransferase CPT1, chloroplastic-like [Nicotiana tabacum]|uniref:Dimethylallylcistransferase CPT1, chloroplastic-like n=1 Tax=Nicotiana tabacum TaxID=4097 RepID=A0AC58SRB0_TOBAC
MTVSEYAIRFSELSRQAPTLVSTVRERVCSFNEGLGYGLRFSTAQELETDTPFQEVVEIARKFGLRISIIGCRSNLPITLQKRIELTEETTKADGLHLVIALNYGGHYDILQATKSIASKVMNGSLQLEDINKNLFDQEFESKCLSIANPDLLTRTGGEQRVSNFLLWQLAYSEYYFTKTLFADFGEKDLEEAICNFQRRHRRFGGHKY